MRFWHWLFRRRTPRRAESRTTPYRTAPDKLPGAPPPPPAARTSLLDLPDPPPARPRPAKVSSIWGLLFGIVGLVGKLASAFSSSSPLPVADPNQDAYTYLDGSRPAPAAPATTGDLENQAPAWSNPSLKAAQANVPPSTTSATAKLSPAATSSPTRSSGASPINTTPLTTSAQAAGSR